MKRMHRTQRSLPVHDYSFAVRRAVSWLGDRYLLAVPINAPRRSPSEGPYFGQPRSWWTHAEIQKHHKSDA